MTDSQNKKFEYVLHEILTSFTTRPELSDDQLTVIKATFKFNEDLKENLSIQIKENNIQIKNTLTESLKNIASESKIIQILKSQENMYNEYSKTFSDFSHTLKDMGNLSNPINFGTAEQIMAYRNGKTKNILLLMGFGCFFSILFFGSIFYFIYKTH